MVHLLQYGLVRSQSKALNKLATKPWFQLPPGTGNGETTTPTNQSLQINATFDVMLQAANTRSRSSNFSWDNTRALVIGWL